MFRHLNLTNAWPGFQLDGVRNDGGTLRLATRPASLAVAGGTRPGLPLDGPGVSGPASVGVDAERNVYIPDPERHRLLRWRVCDGVVAPFRCYGGEGWLPGQFRQPSAVLVGPRGSLYVADRGNHRIQVVDLVSGQLRGVWGQGDPHGLPTPSAEDGRLDQPTGLATDSDGYVYVADRGNRRIQKFDADGRVMPEFWATLAAQPTVPREPAAVATIVLDDDERLLVVDQAASRALVYRTDGSFDGPKTRRWATLTEGVPGGLVFSAGHGLAFDAAGRFLGEVARPGAAGARLALDRRGRLVVRPGGSPGILSPGQAYGSSGKLLAGPFDADQLTTRWQRVKVLADALPSAAHLQFFTYTSDRNDPPPWPLVERSTATPITGPGIWRAAPMDALDFLVLHEAAPYLWIGAELQGDGGASPAIHQIRLEYEHDGWLNYLPAIYARADGPTTLLERTLAAFESVHGSAQAAIDGLPRLFDPDAAPDQPPASWLDWLASWEAFDLEESWTPADRRRALAGAFGLLGRRGTVEGLRALVGLYTGAQAAVDEPARHLSVWSLADGANPNEVGSVLGFTTRLASAQPEGAALGTTAVVDQSHLIAGHEYGAPLFEDLAHRFCVRVRASDLSTPAMMEKLRQVLDREKPAHTSYRICVIEPAMRVGAQARLGVDAVVGGPPPSQALDTGLQLGVDTTLAAGERPRGRTIGADARVGTRLV